jgi:hypothetical protein
VVRRPHRGGQHSDRVDDLALEGKSFHGFGTHGLLWTDAAANLVVFAIVALVFATHGLSIRDAPSAPVLKPEIS